MLSLQNHCFVNYLYFEWKWKYFLPQCVCVKWPSPQTSIGALSRPLCSSTALCRGRAPQGWFFFIGQKKKTSGMVVRVVCTVASLFVVPVVAVEACLGKAFHLENRGLTCKEESFAPPLLFPNHLLFLELAVGRKCLLWWVWFLFFIQILSLQQISTFNLSISVWCPE